ncbi:hypothetical protein [Luteithermobacter gelatinilyticus]|uniref:hypothetical protein n=1 Tax=Luteithermobacter gelatinilyticus TaxID=2582913 RepID=UPI0011071C6D|nr:hypothetical protein [Luteithermobacter gelatinilyticus]
MDMNIVGMHIHELRNQCRYIEANVGVLNQSLEKQAPVGVFFALQGLMTAANQLARILWSPRKKGRDRAARLREILGLPEKHPLNNENILSLWDFSDEANDQWITQSKGEYILYDFIGDIANSPHKDVEMKNIFRAFDVTTKIYTFRGVGYNMEALLKAIADVSNRVNQIHVRLFPDQWKQVDDQGNPVAADGDVANEDTAAPEKPEKQTKDKAEDKTEKKTPGEKTAAKPTKSKK